MTEIEQIEKVILDEKNKTFLILFHINPDGDAIGGALALKFLLERHFNKTVFVYSNNAVPEKYKFLPASESINHDKNLPKSDVTIVLESANIARTGYSAEDLDTKFLINIDHHQTNDFYADINWVESSRAAVSEMLYLLYKGLGKNIDKDAAVGLYVGILTDTGRFQYSNMKPEIYDILKELVNIGVDINFVYRNVYGRKAKTYISFIKSLLDDMEFYCDGKLAISYIDEKTIDEFNISVDDMDGAADYMRDIENVEVSVFIKPNEPGVYKFSLRSKGKIELDKLASSFSGGGHKFAAGFELETDNILDAKNIVLPKVIEVVK